jgi:hypothetical protein
MKDNFDRLKATYPFLVDFPIQSKAARQYVPNSDLTKSPGVLSCIALPRSHADVRRVLAPHGKEFESKVKNSHERCQTRHLNTMDILAPHNWRRLGK